MDYRVRLYEVPWRFALLALPVKCIYCFIVIPCRAIKKNSKMVILTGSVVAAALAITFALKYFEVLP